MGNSATSEIEGQRKVILNMTSRKELTLNNVLYALEIRKNLISRLFLNKHGLWMVFKSDKIVLSKNGMYMGKGYVSDGLFKLNVMIVKSKINKAIFSAYILEFSNMWHSRLGHYKYHLQKDMKYRHHI